MKTAIFIDYDNLQDIQKSAGILAVITKVLLQLPPQVHGTRGSCDVRVYGGWYEGELLSQRAQEIVVSLQQEFPAICRVPSAENKINAITVTAELAFSLLEEPMHHLVDTYRRRRKPGNVRVLKPEDVNCQNVGCLLPKVKKMFQSGKCTMDGCSSNSVNLIYRDEQKIVDTMLTCDLIYAGESNYDFIALVSGDDDFLPPIHTLALRNKAIFRVYPQTNNRRQRTSSQRFRNTLTELDI